MDWVTWLLKTSLEPQLVYEYAQVLTYNELDEEDIAYFNHEFLQSMGISIAKHRLEIIKLARKGQKHPITKLILVLKKTKKSLTKYMARLIHGNEDDGKALIVFSNKKNKNKGKIGTLSYSSRWRRTLMIRNKRIMMLNNQDKLRLTNGDWTPSLEEIKWDAMFKDLKPT